MRKTFFARRGMAVLLALAMLVSMIPAVFAANTDGGCTIVIDSGRREVTVGESIQLSATVTENNATLAGAISWSSSSSFVEVASDTGEVKGIAAGTAIITATFTGTNSSGISVTIEDTCSVEVKAATTPDPTPVTPKLELSRSTLELSRVGENALLTAKVTGATGGTLECTSSNPTALSIYRVGDNITVTAGAVSVDTPVTVSATYSNYNGGGDPLTATCIVTVKSNTQAGNILLDLTGEMKPETLTIKTGSQESLAFELTKTTGDGAKLPVSGNEASFEWESGNRSIVTVVRNLRTNTATLTAVNPGNTVVTVKATYSQNGVSKTATGTCAVEVVKRVGTIRITPTGPFTMEPNGQQRLTATTEPAGEKITWTVPTEDSSIASVQANATGNEAVIYAHSPGKTSVTATIGEGDNTESQSVVVEVSGIILEYNSITLEEDERQMIPMVQRFGSANNGRTISWQSMDISVAEVSGSSVVGRGPGKTTITGFCGAYTASFTVEVSAGTSTIDLTSGSALQAGDILKFSSLMSRFSSQAGGSLSHLTNLSVPTSQGTLFYQYISDAQPGAGVAQSENYYAQGGNGRKTLADVTFVPRANYSGPVTITYNAVASTGEIISCRILHNAEQGITSVFSLSTPYNTALNFNSTEFNRVCNERTGAQLNYVTFSLPPVRQGSLYTNYVNENNYGSAVTTRDTFTRKQLDDVWFVPAPGYEGEVTVYYTARAAGTNGASYSGQVKITVGRDTSVSIGGLSYDVVKNGVARFDDVDFNNYCKDVLDSTQTLSFIRFDSLTSASEGVLYYDYRSTANTGSRASAGTTYYYGTRTPRIDRLVFVPAQDFIGTIRIPFTGQTTGGTRFTGNVEVNVKGSSSGSGSIYYTCQPGKSVSLKSADFNRLCREQVNDRLQHIQFQGLPGSTDGTLYYGSGTSSAAAINRSYYYGTTYPRIDNLTFRASNRFSGSVDIPFIGTAASGETFYGVITVDSSSGSGSSDNDIHYYTDSKTAAVFDRDDFDDLSRWVTERDVSSVKFTPPATSQGSLYQNYRSSSSQGTRITSSSTTILASSLDRVAFLPASGFTGTVYVDFTARAANSEEFSGTVEITVERAAADVTVRYSTRVSLVAFLGSDFARSGYTLRSIQFGAMPPSSAGHLYYQYSSPTRYDRQASTGSTYNLTGSNLISSLTFVPKAGYSGTVTLPYTGTNSNGSTFEGEVVITVSPTYSSSYFNDMSGYSDAERAAVDYLCESGITSGVGGGRYGPTSSITRGDFALMVYKAFGLTASGSSQFSDVPSWAYYAQAVNTLHALGIVSGVGNGRFGPDSNVTREDALIMVRQAMRSVGWSASDGFSSTLNSYSDGSTVSQYAQGAVSFALQMGYLPTINGLVAPRENLTRVDMAQILHRVLTS